VGLRRGWAGGKEIYVHRDGWHRNGEWSVLSSVVSLKNQEYRGKGRLEGERERERERCASLLEASRAICWCRSDQFEHLL
jgi:hypothetical protein